MRKVKNFKVNTEIKRWHLWVLVSLFMGVVLWITFTPLPSLCTSYSTVLLDKHGEMLGAAIATDEQWRFPRSDSVPEKFMHAIIQFEDHRFFYHPGIDPLALCRAIFKNIRSGSVVSGASTISMQVIRLSRRGQPRSIWEKCVEMILAICYELKVSKKHILNTYASHAPFGGNVVGLEAASWRYFGCSSGQLSWAECAMLAVLPNSPALIHPGRNREALLKKRDLLLTKLWKKDIIDSTTCYLSKLEPLPDKPHRIPSSAPHLLERIKGERNRKNHKNPFCYFQTTLDNNIQKQAYTIVSRHHGELAANGIHNAAALIVDVKSSAILAYIGNIVKKSDADHGNFVDIIAAPRSTGSILKPLLYASMVQEGQLLPTQLVPDIPVRVGGFSPKNYTREYDGAVPASKALARSLNVPAVHLLSHYSVDKFYTQLQKLGLTTLHRPAKEYGLTLILGGAEGTLWDIVGSYVSIAQVINNYFDTSVKGESTKVPLKMHYLIKQQYPNRHVASIPLEAPACWVTMETLLEVNRPEEESAWRNFTSSKKIAWKTGTSYGFRDGWAVGVTPHYAIGVWVGNADGEGRPGLTGISSAAPILFELFSLLPSTGWFRRPEADLVTVDICAHSGFLMGPNCEKTTVAVGPSLNADRQTCPYCKKIHCDMSQTWQVHSDCEDMDNIRSLSWFILPPAMEWFYRQKHSQYKTPPPFRKDCQKTGDQQSARNLGIIYPKRNSSVYIPLELSGQRGRLVVKAAHRLSNSQVFWHLDKQYLGTTQEIHHMEIITGPGEHRLTLVDERGEVLQRTFSVLNRD